MRVYALQHDFGFGSDEELLIDAMADSSNVPLEDCPLCGRGWGSCLRYPFFRPGKDGSPRLKRLWRQRHDHSDIPRNPADFWVWLEEFRRVMASECPRATLISPGTDFGPLRLVVTREVDVANVGGGQQLVARDSVVTRLQSQGIQLEPCLTLVRPLRDRSSDDYLELYADDLPRIKPAEPYREFFAKPCARKADSHPGELCPKCLRFDKEWDWSEPMPISARSIPRDADLFRVLERPAAILATERFVDAVAGLNTWRVDWQAVEVAG